MRRLPPLNALRAFEASARHLSFTRAAAELCVTQGAISRHVKGLEEVLGVRLFHRRQRGLELTREGAQFLPRLSDAFDQIAQAAAALGRARHDLTLKVLPTFAIRWLIPRLTRFQEHHPEIQVRLTTSWHGVDFEREDFDAGISHTDCLRPGGRVDRIFPEALIPVCAPALMAGRHPLRRPEDLAHHTMLHGPAAPPADWRTWLTVYGVRGVDADSGQRFDIDDAVWRAAVAGLGVGLAMPAFVAEDLAAGRLVAPFDLPPIPAGDYCLVYPEHAADLPKLTLFRDWLLAEAAP